MPRILIRRTGNFLCCSYLKEPALTESTLYSCWSNTSEIGNEYLLALLNSSLLTYYMRQSMITNKQGFPQILMTDLEELPIVKISKLQQQSFTTLVNYILLLKENINIIHPSIPNSLFIKNIEEILDGMVLELYLEEEMKNKQIDIIELVEKELEKSRSSNIAENINNFFTSVSNPDGEIRNRILLFPIASPDIIKPILKS